MARPPLCEKYTDVIMKRSSNTLNKHHEGVSIKPFPGPSAAGKLPASVQGCIHSVSRKGFYRAVTWQRAHLRNTFCMFGAALLLLFNTVGCSSRMHIPYSADRRPPPAQVAYKDVFAYTADKIVVEQLQHKSKLQYEVSKIRFPSQGNNGQENNLVVGEYYKSRLPGKKPLVIVMPIWGVSAYPSDEMSRHILEYSEGKINVFKFQGKRYLLDWPGMRNTGSKQEFIDKMHETAERLRTAGIDIRRFIDWAEMQPEVDRERLGIIGFSIGAMIAGAIMPHEQRLQSAVLVMGGAQPHSLFSDCPWRPKVVRDLAMQKYHWSRQDYQQLMREVFASLDPAQFPGRVNPEHVLIFDSKYDECISESSRNDLWATMGYPERVSLLYDHETAFLAMTPLGKNYIRHKAYRFLEQIFFSDTDPKGYLTLEQHN